MAELNVVQKIINASDCCGTCAGGVLARYVREQKAEALSEAAKDGPGSTSGDHLWRLWLETRAERIARGT